MLVEDRFGHGGKVRSKLYHKVKRAFRASIGMSAIPFDWTKGILGRPIYNVKNQFQSKSCWGQMFSRMIQIIKGSEELSAKSAYSPIYAVGGGVYLPDGENEALYMGLTTEASVLSIQDGNCTEQFMEDVVWRSRQAILDSAMRAGMKVVNVNIDIDSIAQAIREYGCVGWLIEGSNNGTWLSQFPQPPKDNTNLWAHFMCSDSNVQPINSLSGIGTKTIRMYNSWGTTVGINGFQDFTENYIKSGYIMDVFTFVKFQFNNNLSFMQNSSDVKMLQVMLNRNPQTMVAQSQSGSPGLETSYFGSMTLNAVKRFQKLYNIPQTGLVGPLTRAKLNSLI